MPTKNRRIATYLPQEIDVAFKTFKSDRNIEGDSQALITILSEFLGVSQQVAYQSSSFVADLERRVEELEARTTRIKSELFDELRSELRSELSKGEDLETLSGQLNLLASELENAPVALPSAHSVDSELLSELSNSTSVVQTEWITTKEAWERLNRPCSYDAFRKYSPEKLHETYGLQVDLQRRQEGKYSPKWLKLSDSSVIK